MFQEYNDLVCCVNAYARSHERSYSVSRDIASINENKAAMKGAVKDGTRGQEHRMQHDLWRNDKRRKRKTMHACQASANKRQRGIQLRRDRFGMSHLLAMALLSCELLTSFKGGGRQAGERMSMQFVEAGNEAVKREQPGVERPHRMQKSVVAAVTAL